MIYSKAHRFWLQLLAEGAGGESGGTAPAAGEQSNVEGQVVADQSEPTVDLDAEFDGLVHRKTGKFASQYNARVRAAVENRVKGINEKLNGYAPIAEELAARYGKDASDLGGILEALKGDNTRIQQVAEQMGVDDDVAREFVETQRQNAEYKRREQQRREAEQFAKWDSEIEAMQDKYPEFNFANEMRNPTFKALVDTGATFESAYRAIHAEEIISAGIARASASAEQNVVNRIAAKGNRPVESGAKPKGGTATPVGLENMSKADRDKIAERVLRGEKISF